MSGAPDAAAGTTVWMQSAAASWPNLFDCREWDRAGGRPGARDDRSTLPQSTSIPDLEDLLTLSESVECPRDRTDLHAWEENQVSEEWSISWMWWTTAIEVPVLGCMFWLIHHGRRESERALLRIYREIQGNLNMVLDNLAQSKLEIARFYATVTDLKDVEKRLTDHLLRLETRLTYLLPSNPAARPDWPRSQSENRAARPGMVDPDAA